MAQDGRHWTERKAPYDRDQALAACEAMRRGLTLKEWCERCQRDDPQYPDPSDIRGWYVTNAGGEFAQMYTQARRALAECWAEEIVTIAEDGTNDWEARRRADGTLGQKVNHECVQRSKLRVDTRRWLLSKLHPDVYAERVQHQTLGADGRAVDPPSNVSPIELSAMLKAWKPKGE